MVMSCSLQGAPDTSCAPTWLIHVVEVQHMVFFGVQRIVRNFFISLLSPLQKKELNKVSGRIDNIQQGRGVFATESTT